MLEILGLTTDAELLYHNLLQCPDKPLQQIAAELKLTNDSIQTAFGLLMELGAIETRSGKNFPVPPERVTTNLLMRQEEEITELQRRHVHSQTAVKNYLSEREELTSHQDIFREHFFGIETVRNRISRLGNDAKTNIKTFAPGNTINLSSINSAQQTTQESLDRGVVSQTLYVTSALRNKTLHRYLEWLNGHGALVRTTPYLPIRMIIFDDKVAVLPLSLTDALAGISVEKSEGVLRALLGLFEKFWEDATPFGETKTNSELDATATGVLKLLATGRTAEQISREMSMSTKAINRIIADLEIELGANNRFTLGAAAVKAGWLN